MKCLTIFAAVILLPSFLSADGSLTDKKTPANQSRARVATYKEEIAQADEPRQKEFQRNGDWDYKQNWDWNTHAYFTGETQASFDRKENPYGQKGIGYDGDDEYEQRKNQEPYDSVEVSRDDSQDNYGQSSRKASRGGSYRRNN